MLLWLVLFFIIIAISLLLAILSMRDFAEKPSALGRDYALFLIRNPSALSFQLMTELHQTTLTTNHIITLERLFKGAKSALVVFGPKSILDRFPDLNLLELEDYTNVGANQFIAWEVGTKDLVRFHFYPVNVFKALPKLNSDEQFWWQLTLRGNKGKLWPTWHVSFLSQKIMDITATLFSFNVRTDEVGKLNKFLSDNPQLQVVAEQKNAQPVFQTEIRAVVVAPSDRVRNGLAKQLENIDAGKLVKLPKAYTSIQILSLYQQRARLSSNFQPLNLTVDEVLQLSIGN